MNNAKWSNDGVAKWRGYELHASSDEYAAYFRGRLVANGYAANMQQAKNNAEGAATFDMHCRGVDV